MKVAVYGSLRQGMHNHDIIGDSPLIGIKTYDLPYKMVDLNRYPALIPDERTHRTVFEIYDVNDEVYHNIEYLEGYPDFYQKSWVDGVEFYFVPDEQKYYSSRFADEDHIEDWVAYRQAKGLD